MSNARLLLLGLILLTGMSLTACGKKSERDMLVPEAGVESGRVEDTFGEGFGEAFRADSNAEPRNVVDSDVKPVSLTTEPVPIN